jgi:hypothetical protein
LLEFLRGNGNVMTDDPEYCGSSIKASPACASYIP